MAIDHPEHLHEVFSRALRSGDAERLLGLYERDAVAVRPDGGRVSGEVALHAMVSGLISSGIGEGMQGAVRKVLVNGDVALTSTAWSNVVTQPDGTVTTQHGVTAELSRRQPDGTWKVVIDDPTFA